MRSGQLRCRETYAKLTDFWMPYVDSTVTYPVDCVFTADELDIIDQYRTDFETQYQRMKNCSRYTRMRMIVMQKMKNKEI